MMDFRSLDVGTKPADARADAVHDFTPIDPASVEYEEGTVEEDSETGELDYSEAVPIPGSEKPFLNGAGKPLVLQLADPSSPRARREMVKLRIKWPPVEPDQKIPDAERREMAKEQNVSLDEIPVYTWSEQALDRAASSNAGRDRELLARFVVGWNIEHDGKPVEFSVEHAAEFFEVFPSVAAVTMIRIGELMSAAGNAESGSAGGPRKTDGSDESTTTPAKAGGKR